MLPILLDLKIIKIYTYGVFLILAFFWSSFFLWKNVQLTSYKEEDVFDTLFAALFGGLFFGRLVYVILNFEKFGFDILKFILINGYPGINVYGALAGSFFVVYLYSKTKKMKFNEIVDYAILPAFLALAIGEIGAFFAGAEVGTKTEFLLRVKYINYDGLRHLTGFYEGLLFFLASFIAYRLLFEIRRQKYYQGFLFVFFWWYTSLVLSLFDSLKINRSLLLGKSFTQYMSLIILLTLTAYMLYYLRVVIFNKLKSVIHLPNIHGRKK